VLFEFFSAPSAIKALLFGLPKTRRVSGTATEQSASLFFFV